VWGFYGEDDYALKEARSVVDYDLDYQAKMEAEIEHY
jgi:hypothetical protein